jgi:LmbE family N-acetylglucosaminyl deacetylase
MPFTLMCVHPHPDDETLACGGVLALAAAGGHHTVVVTATGGEEGENLGGVDLHGRDLADVRRDEMAAAVDVLGVSAHYWLGYRDSGMAGSPANRHPDAFAMAGLDEAAARLATLIRQVRPDVIVSDHEDGTYGHPDHVKANQVTVRACVLAADTHVDLAGEPWQVAKRYVHTVSRERLMTVVKGLTDAGLASPFADTDVTIGVADERITTRVDVTAVKDVTRAALACHASQVGPDSFFFNIPEPYASLLFDVEEFMLVAGTGKDSETDLFAGLRP